MEKNYQYDGGFCAKHIPRAIILIVAGVYLYDTSIYFSIATFIFFFITITSLIKCKNRSPDHIAVISNNMVTINLPGNINSIPVNSIESAELRLNRIVINLKYRKPVVIRGNYWQTTSDMKDFKDNINAISRSI